MDIQNFEIISFAESTLWWDKMTQMIIRYLSVSQIYSMNQRARFLSSNK